MVRPHSQARVSRSTPDRPRRARSLWAASVTTVGLVAALIPGLSGARATTATATTATIAANPYERGPAPTVAGIEAVSGHYAVSKISVPSASVTGFGGGTIYYPTSTTDGTFGAVAIAPGFTATQSSVAWLGPRLASQGFVVFTIDTTTTLDQPSSRGGQLLAALDHLTRRSAVSGRIDSARLGVIGHSMGGGGTLEAAKSRTSLKAAIPLTGWNLDTTWPEVRTPTLVVGADGDVVAPVASFSEPFYQSLPSTLDKAYLELNNATHSTPTMANTTIAKYSVSWLKRFIDGDTRYEQFLCPIPVPGAAIDEYRGNCPHASA